MSGMLGLTLHGARKIPSSLLHGPGCDTVHRLRRASLWSADYFQPSKYSSITLARTQKDLNNIGRLRYELFVERDHKAYAADHSNSVFLEPIDKLSLNIQAVDADREKCLAAVRLTRGQDGMGDRQLAAILTNCELARPPYANCVLLSRLTVRPEPRARSRIADLMRHTYSLGLRQGARYALLATRPSLIPMFRRFGSVPTGRRLHDPVASDLEILVLDLLNRDHLAAVSSPLLAELDAFLANSTPDTDESLHQYAPT